MLVFGEVVAEPVEPPLPDRPLVMDPSLDVPKGIRLDVAGTDAAYLLRGHQRARLEHLQVLHHRGQGHRQGLCELAHRGRTSHEPLDDQPARGVGESLEDPIEVDWLVNHVLEYWRVGINSQERA